MITKITSENRAQYTELFDKASAFLATHTENLEPCDPGSSEALLEATEVGSLEGFNYVPGVYWYKTTELVPDPNTEGEYIEKDVYVKDEADEATEGRRYFSFGITSLSEYFSYIRELVAWELDQTGKGLPVTKFSFLPLDEDLFEIDANARTISVPSETFAKYGVSVQGDEIAETVYFKIDRFYDAQDLADPKIKPIIQWTSAAKDNEGNPKTGISVPWTIDYDMYPGYVVIGWPISSAITEEAGTVELAVRFVKIDEVTDKLQYSLATQPQTVQIKKSLDFDLTPYVQNGQWLTNVEDNTNLIFNRFTDTVYNDPNNQAGVPEILLDLEPLMNLAENSADRKFKSANTTALLQAVTPSDQSGSITYTWKKYRLDNNQLEPISWVTVYKPARIIRDLALGTENAAKEAAEAEFKKRIYYIQDSENPQAYKSYNGSNLKNIIAGTITEEGAPDNGWVQLYERYSQADITSEGRYQVLVTNRVGRSTATAESAIMIVPAPGAPVFTLYKIGETAVETNEAARAILRDETPEVLTVQSATEDAGDITYEWYKVDLERKDATLDEDEERGILVENPNDNADLSLDKSNTLSVNEEGLYYCKAINHLNKKETTDETADTAITYSEVEFKVTKPAEKLIVRFASPDVDHKLLSEAKVEGLNFVVEYPADSNQALLENWFDPDKTAIEYQWYKYRQAHGANVNEDIAASKNNAYEPSITGSDQDDIILEGATEAVYKPTEDGYYFLRVTHNLNGTSAVQYSPIWTVNNA